MSLFLVLLCCVGGLRDCACGGPPKVVKGRVQGAFRFPGDEYVRITGVPKVIDAHPLSLPFRSRGGIVADQGELHEF